MTIQAMRGDEERWFVGGEICGDGMGREVGVVGERRLGRRE